MKLLDTYTRCNETFFQIDKSGKTVLDTNTGLVWEIKSSQPDEINYGGNQYNHEEALTGYIGSLNQAIYGGYTDWRMPNMDELRTILDYDMEGIAINRRIFGNCQVGDYWTKNLFLPGTNGKEPAMAWVLYFDFGSAIVKSRETKRYVMAVRGGKDKRFGEPDNSRFKDNGDGTITDAATGLMWQKGENGRVSLEEAKAACAAMNLAGFHDWRLPNIKEINTIQNLSYQEGSWFFKDFFPADGVSGMLHYRASTMFKEHYSWVTNFSMGYDGYYAGTEAPLLFRAVRSIGEQEKLQSPAAFAILHTGEDTVYNLDGKKIEGSSDQLLDAERITILPSYIKWEQSALVTEQMTGLTWETAHVGERLRFEEAKELVERLNEDAYEGYRDWRLPLREELRSIMCYNGQIPAVDREAFPSIQPGFLWTGQENKADHALAWTFYTGYGCAVIAKKNQKAGVLLVRGRDGKNTFLLPSGERFLVNGDGTVSDNATGLMWMQKETPLLTLTESMHYCRECRLGGYDDWCLPNMKELGTLINLTEGDKWFFPEIFPDTNIAPQGFYLSSTTFDASFGWGCNFQFGFDGYYADRKNGKYPFRPVRTIR